MPTILVGVVSNVSSRPQFSIVVVFSDASVFDESEETPLPHAIKARGVSTARPVTVKVLQRAGAERRERRLRLESVDVVRVIV